MKAFASLLLVGVLARHFSYQAIGANTYLGARGWHYVMGGLWEILLCAALALVIWETKKSAWKWIALYALGVAMIESLQASLCRIAITNMSSVPKGANICDFVTGFPITATVNTLYLMMLALIVGAILRAKKSSS